MARMNRLQLGAALVGLASTMLGAVGCSSEDEPDVTQDAASDASGDARNDQSVTPDAKNDTVVTSDASDAGKGDAGGDVRIDTTGDAGACLGPGADAGFIDAAAGLALVQGLGCAGCHQDQPVDAGIILSGRTTTSVADAGVYARNLTPDPVTGLGCWSDEQIITAFMTGVDKDGKTLCRMPTFATRVDGGAPQEIVNFLRSLPAVNKLIKETDPVCPPRPPTPEGGTDVRDAGADATDDVTPEAGSPDVAADVPVVDVAPDAGTMDAGTPDATDGGGTTDGGANDGATADAGDAGTG